MNLDKSTWQKVRLGDVATEYSARENDPSQSDHERFVGSANIGQWDFRVKSWESTADVTSAMKKFGIGDYLLVRRSLYASDFRERAPRAHFEGVCSGDILTIREKPDLIADGFLIGVLNSPALWQYVVANGSGSITRRIKWRELAEYEFLLPPYSLQARLSELLWAAEEVGSAYSTLLSIQKDLLELLRDELIFSGNSNKTIGRHGGKGNLANSWDVQRISDAVEIASGQVNPTLDAYRDLIQIGAEHIEEKTGKIINKQTAAELNLISGKYQFDESHVLYSKIRPYLRKVANPDFAGLCSADMYPMRGKDGKIEKGYLFHFLLSKEFTNSIMKHQVRTGMPKVNRDELGSVLIPIPPLETQRLIVAKLEAVQLQVDVAWKVAQAEFEIKTQLINQIFSA